MNELRFMVPGMSCGHCANAIRAELSELAGVVVVEIDIDSRWVIVRGRGVAVGTVRMAVEQAGHVAQL